MLLELRPLLGLRRLDEADGSAGSRPERHVVGGGRPGRASQQVLLDVLLKRRLRVSSAPARLAYRLSRCAVELDSSYGRRDQRLLALL